MFKWEKRDQNAPSKRADFVVCWIKDLFDPSKGQTKDALEDKDGNNCCLGVACNTANLKKEIQESYVCFFNNGKNGETEESELPKNLYKFLSCFDKDGTFSNPLNIKTNSRILPYGEDNSLINLNDSENFTFYRIATVIATYPELIFNGYSQAEFNYIKTEGLKLKPSYKDYRSAKAAQKRKDKKDANSTTSL